jgi:hypothetical protein
VTPMRITLVLTVLSAIVVVLTRVRLAKDEGAGRLSIPHGLLNLHTAAGVPALLVWVAFLYTEIVVLGWLGLALWWITVIAGLLLLARWMPAKGKHSSGPAGDTWGEGPGLSILAHVGLLLGVAIFTAFLVLDQLP